MQNNLINAHLISYGVKKQFIELEFTSANYNEIMFFLDCKIICDNTNVTKLVESLKDGCIDTYDIGYFIFVNLKYIFDCYFDENENFVIKFENNIQIIFDVNSEEDSDLSITFRKRTTDENYIAIELLSEGEYDVSEITGNIVNGNVSD